VKTPAEFYARGVGLRRKTPREKHADLHSPGDRDAMAILAQAYAKRTNRDYDRLMQVKGKLVKTGSKASKRH
jgi:hypothetical protein